MNQSTPAHTQRVDFGTITDYVAPKPSFPGSIMNLSNTGTRRFRSNFDLNGRNNRDGRRPLPCPTQPKPPSPIDLTFLHTTRHGVTGGGGRGSDKGSIIGDVICHGKKKYWLKGCVASIRPHGGLIET